MAVLTRGKEALRYAGTATAAMPYLREAATDDELRESLRGARHALARIADEMASDERLRGRLFGRATRAEARRVRARRRRRRLARWGLIVSGLLAGVAVVAAVAAVLLYPASRRRITQTVGDARRNVTSVAGRVRHKTAEPDETPGTDETSASAGPIGTAA